MNGLDIVPADRTEGAVRQRHRLAARITRLLLESNGDAAGALFLLDDVMLPAPWATFVRAAAEVNEDGEKVNFDTASERIRKAGFLEAVGGYNGIERLKRGDEECPGPNSIAECLNHYRDLDREINSIDGSVERLREAGFKVETPAFDTTPFPADTEARPAPPVQAWPDPPAPEAFHGVLGELVRAIEPHSEADPIGIMTQSLVMFGNCVGGTPYFVVEGTRHHVNEFMVNVGPTSGGRKGSGMDRARRPFTEADEGWARDRIMSGASSGEGLIDAVRDAVEEEQPVKEKGKVVGYQTVRTDEGAADKRLLVYEPEFARALQVMSREGCTLSTTIRQAWDSPDLRVMTRGSKLRATGSHISIIGHITQDELLRQMERTEAASGFGNRFLWLCVRRSKFLPEGGDVSPEGMAPLVTRLSRAVSYSRQVGEMKRDDAARELWAQQYERLATGRPGLLGSMLGRCEAHVTRLSMLYALADCSNTIKQVHLEAALALWDYCERSCRFIFGDNLGDPTADELLRALRAAPDGLSQTEMSHHFGRNKTASEIGRALNVLARQGLAFMAPAGERTAGRPAKRWMASSRSSS
jgi:hypothetical protein